MLPTFIRSPHGLLPKIHPLESNLLFIIFSTCNSREKICFILPGSGLPHMPRPLAKPKDGDCRDTGISLACWGICGFRQLALTTFVVGSPLCRVARIDGPELPAKDMFDSGY